MWSCLLILVALCPLRTDAEGSATVFPSSGECATIYLNGSCRANIEWRTDTYGPVGTSIMRRTLFYVFAKKDEVLFLGSTARSASGSGADLSDILVYAPGRVTGTKGSETVPATSDLSCRTAQPTKGRINSRAEELAGPQVSGSPAGGYVPCTYVAPRTGIYNVIMYGPWGSTNSTNGYVTGDLSMSSNLDQSQGTTVAGWDITVRSSLTSNVSLPGRAFTYAIAAFTGANDRPVKMTYYVVITDGYRYKVQTAGMDPAGWIMYANQLGFLDPDGVTPLYHDVRGNNGQLRLLQGGAKFAAPQYPLFFSPADNDTLAALNIPLIPTIPVISDLTFNGTVSSNIALYGSGGAFSFTSNIPAVYEIILSPDENNFDPTILTNRVLRGATPSGSHTVTWNGKDNNGNAFPVGSYYVKASIHGGEYHFPFIDVENNVRGGPQIQLLNAATCGDFNGGCTGAFYDDRGYRTSSGGVVGVVNGALCPSQTLQNPFSDPVFGFDTTDSDVRAWGGQDGNINVDCLGSFGDAKGLDLWTYVPSARLQTTMTVIDYGITGHVFRDLYDDGIEDTDDYPLANILVEVQTSQGGLFAALTDSMGNYFIQLPGGITYTISIAAPNGYVTAGSLDQGPFSVVAQPLVVAATVGISYDSTPSPTNGVAPLIGGSPPSTTVVGNFYSYQFFFTAGAPAPQYSFTGVPAWMTVDPSSGLVYGIPDTNATYTIGVTASNSYGSSSLTYILVVDGYAPTISGTPSLTATYGTPYSANFSINGFPFPLMEVFGPSWLSINAMGQIFGTPNAISSTLVEVRASNAYGNASQFYTLNVIGVSPEVSGNLPPATINTPYSYQLVLSGFPTPGLTLTGPAWASISPSGVISGTPDSVGTFTITITASNDAGISQQFYNLVVNGVPPSVTSAAPPSGTLGTAYYYTVTATGTPSPTYTLSGAPGLSINATTGVISGIPTQMGIFSITVTASNGYGPGSVQTSTITIGTLAPTSGAPTAPAPSAPHITSTPNPTALIGSLYSYTLTATGNPVPAFTIVSGPSWLTLSGNVIQGTPAPSDSGSIVMIVRASNGISPNDLQTFRLTVAASSPTPVQAPVITSTAPTTAYLGVPFSYNITFTGASPVFLLADGLPSWAHLEGCCTLAGTPTQLGLTGVITVTASNGYQPNYVQPFQISVVPMPTNPPTGVPSRPPSPQPTSIVPPSITSTPVTSATINAPYVYYITTTGFPTPTLTTRLSDLPSWLHFNNGILSGTPTAGTAGSVTISLTASNGVNPNATQVFTLVVSNIPSAPAILSNPPLSGPVGSIYVYPILATGSPMPNITVSGPPFLTLAMNGGILSLLGNSTTPGNYTVSLVASNGVGSPAVQTFSLEIVAASSLAPTAAPTTTGVPPSFTSLPSNVATSQSPFVYTVTTSGSPAPQFRLYGAPSWLTLFPNGTLFGTPPSTLTGTLTFRVDADNGMPPVASQLVTIQVNPMNYSAPVITSNATTTTIGSGLLYTYTASATGFPTPVFLWTLPSWLTVSANNVISGRPPTAGSYSVSLLASNGVAPADVQTFVINVFQSSFAPTPVGVISTGDGLFSPSITSNYSTTALTGLTYTYNVTMSGNPTPTLVTSGLPAWLSLSGCCTITGNAPTVITGSVIFGLTAINGINPPATQTVRINFADPPAPRITSPPVTIAESTKPYKYTIVATGSPAPNITAGTLPSWLSLDSGTLKGTPPPSSTNSSFNISITASNGVGASVQQNFTLAVASYQIPPTILSQASKTAVAGQTYSYTILTSGNPAANLTVSGNPSWLSLTNDTLSGVATGYGTLPPITVVANNGVSPAFTQIFTLEVISLPVVGAAQSQPGSVPYGTIYNVIYPVSGSPAPKLSISGNPAWLSLVGNVVTGTPPVSALSSVVCYTLTATNSAGSSSKTTCFDVILPGQETCQDGLQRMKGELDYLSRVASGTCPNAASNSSGSVTSLCHSECDNPVAYVTTLVLSNGLVTGRRLLQALNSTDQTAVAKAAASAWGLSQNNVYTLGSDVLNGSYTSVRMLAVAPSNFAFTPVTSVAGRTVAQSYSLAASQSDMLDFLALLLQANATGTQAQVAANQQVVVDDTTPWWVYFLLVVLIISFLCWALCCFGFLRNRNKPLKEDQSVMLAESRRASQDGDDNKHNDDRSAERSVERLKLQQQLQDLLAQKRRTLDEITALQADIQREQENHLLDGEQLAQEQEVSRLLKQMVELEATQQQQHATQIAALNAEIAALRRAADRSAQEPDSSAVQEQIRELGSAYQELKREQELQKQSQIKEQKKLLDTVENLSRALEKSRKEGDSLRDQLERDRREREALEQAAAAERARADKERADRTRERSTADKAEQERLERARLEAEHLRLQNVRDRTAADKAEQDRLERERLERMRLEAEHSRLKGERERLDATRAADASSRIPKPSSSPQVISNFNFSDDSGLEDDSGGSDNEPQALHFPKGPGLNEDDVDMAKFATLSHADKGVFEQWKAREAHAQAQKSKEKRKKTRQLARRQARHIARREAKAAAARAAGSS